MFNDLFFFTGRRNRKSFILVLLPLYVVMMLIWLLSIFLVAWAPLIIAALLTIPALIIGGAIGSQRCRDFNCTGWAVLLTFIPYLGFFVAVALMFIPGNPGPNRFGPDPLAAS